MKEFFANLNSPVGSSNIRTLSAVNSINTVSGASQTANQLASNALANSQNYTQQGVDLLQQVMQQALAQNSGAQQQADSARQLQSTLLGLQQPQTTTQPTSGTAPTTTSPVNVTGSGASSGNTGTLDLFNQRLGTAQSAVASTQKLVEQLMGHFSSDYTKGKDTLQDVMKVATFISDNNLYNENFLQQSVDDRGRQVVTVSNKLRPVLNAFKGVMNLRVANDGTILAPHSDKKVADYKDKYDANGNLIISWPGANYVGQALNKYNAIFDYLTGLSDAVSDNEVRTKLNDQAEVLKQFAVQEKSYQQQRVGNAHAKARGYIPDTSLFDSLATKRQELINTINDLQQPINLGGQQYFQDIQKSLAPQATTTSQQAATTAASVPGAISTQPTTPNPATAQPTTVQQPLSQEELNQNAMNALRNQPGFQFALQEGINAVERSQAGRGMLQSGNTLRALEELGQNLASQQFQQTLTNLSTITGQGLQAGQANQQAITQTGAQQSDLLNQLGLTGAQLAQGTQNLLGQLTTAAANPQSKLKL